MENDDLNGQDEKKTDKKYTNSYSETHNERLKKAKTKDKRRKDSNEEQEKKILAELRCGRARAEHHT